jgi:DNA-binding NarL/FixJ family response regulator
VKYNKSNSPAIAEATLASAIEMRPGFGRENFVKCLSPSEKNFLERLADGHSYHRIAKGMNVSINTVRDYVRSVCKKIRVNSRTQAVSKYLRAQLETTPPKPGKPVAKKARARASTIRSVPSVPLARAPKSRVFLVDDHEIFREGLRMLIDRESDLEVCGEAAGVDQALLGIKELKPDVAITGLSLSGTIGIDLIITLKSKFEGLPVLVVSMHEESFYAERVLRAGADGYVMKHEPAKTVKMAIRKVLGGDIHLSEKMTTSLLDILLRDVQSKVSSSLLAKLSNRELEVFKMVGMGKMTRHISKHLGVKSVTIETFRHRIRRKLGLKNSAEVVLQANKWARDGNIETN